MNEGEFWRLTEAAKAASDACRTDGLLLAV